MCDVGNGVCRTILPERAEPVNPGDVPSIRTSATTSRCCPAMLRTVHRRIRRRPDCSADGVALEAADTAWVALPSQGAHDAAVTVLTRAHALPARQACRCSCSKTTSRSTASRTPAAASTYCLRTSPASVDSRSRFLTTPAARAMQPDSPLTTCSTCRCRTAWREQSIRHRSWMHARISTEPTTPRAGPKRTIGITGMIVTCPKYEADGKTLSPLAGQAVVANLYPGRYGVVATPGRRPNRARRRVAADQHARRSEGPRFVPAHRRAELTSRNSDRPDTTSRSASPIRRSSMTAWQACAAGTDRNLPGTNCATP